MLLNSRCSKSLLGKSTVAALALTIDPGTDKVGTAQLKSHALACRLRMCNRPTISLSLFTVGIKLRLSDDETQVRAKSRRAAVSAAVLISRAVELKRHSCAKRQWMASFGHATTWTEARMANP
jgi:hypothetical protein